MLLTLKKGKGFVCAMRSTLSANRNMKKFEFIERELEEARKRDGFRALKTRNHFLNGKYGHVQIQGKEVVLFASNDYLGLSCHPEVIEAAVEGVKQFGVGSGASQLISGHTEAHSHLEKRLSSFMDTEASLIFPSGFQANLSVISTLIGKDDLVVMDKLNHASLIDGCRLSEAHFRVFPHKNYERLDEILSSHSEAPRKLIVSDSVFSMDGDFADLEKLCELKEKHGAILLVDEAHAIGVFGLKGSGLVEEKKLLDKVDIRVGTLSKSIGCQGGFVSASNQIIDYLVNFARPLIFSTAVPPHLCSAASKAIDLIESGRELRQQFLWDVFTIKEELVKDLQFEIGSTESPIIPILLGESKRALEFSRELMERGFYVPAIRPPAVPKGKARLRLALSAAHLSEDKEGLLFALKELRGRY